MNEEWTAIARRYWAEAGVASKIRLHLAPALETLDALVRDGRRGEFDIAFIDADKVSYDVYYERCLELLRPGGLVLVDNVLWSGAVADEDDRSEDTVAQRAFNAKLRRRYADRAEHAAGGRRADDCAKARLSVLAFEAGAEVAFNPPTTALAPAECTPRARPPTGVAGEADLHHLVLDAAGIPWVRTIVWTVATLGIVATLVGLALGPG